MRVIGRVEGVGLVPRQAAGHLQQLADGDVRAPVAVPLRAQVVVVEGDRPSCTSRPTSRSVTLLVIDQPSCGVVGPKPGGVPLRDELAVLQHDHGPGAELRPVRMPGGRRRTRGRAPARTAGAGSGAAASAKGLPAASTTVGVGRSGRRSSSVQPKPALAHAVCGASTPRMLLVALSGRVAVRSTRHERVGRQVVLGIAATGDGGQRAGVVGGVPGAGEQQRPLPDVAAAHGQHEQADDDEGDAPSRAHGEMINHRPRGGRAACPTPSRDRVDRSAWPGHTAR